MVFKNFRVNVLFRTLLLGLTIILFFFLLYRTDYYVAITLTGVLILLEVSSLIQYVEKITRDLQRFLLAVKYSDYSQTFTGSGMGKPFAGLKAAFSSILQEIQTARAEKEEQFRYLQTVVQHVGSALLVYEQDGDIQLANNVALRLFDIGPAGKIKRLRHIAALAALSPELVDTLQSIQPGERRLVKIIVAGEERQLSIDATQFRMKGNKYTLVSIQNIQRELEEKEMEAWQNLIRVLTHEIMNSVTPISSLASTTQDLLKSYIPAAGAGEGAGQTLEDIRAALHTIERRSQGLLHFVSAYRQLTRIPHPELAPLRIANLFERIKTLIQPQMDEKRIAFSADVRPKDLQVRADVELIEQVLINVLLNAIQALEGRENGRIEMVARYGERSAVTLLIRDNGAGISPEAQKKIFIPFFTTKKGGSGIGLSISRQIMRLHGGAISVYSQPEKGTEVMLRF